ncbi:hypothetical protein [Salibacterium aidingense]|nr:hypothetical protein [Salibacterium aidingense]
MFFLFAGLLAIIVTTISIELKLRKANEQNEKMIELLKQIKEKQ